MPRYTVEVSRRVDLVRYDTGTVEVDAETKKEAEKYVQRNFDCTDVEWEENDTEEIDEGELEINKVILSDDQPEEDEPEYVEDDEPEEVYDEEEGVYLTVGGKI